MFKKEAIFCYFQGTFIWESTWLDLGEYPTRGDVADMSNLFYFYFCVYMIQGDGVLTEISPFEAKWD